MSYDMDEQKYAEALSYIPVLLDQLDNTGRDMLVVVMQAQRQGGYNDGFSDGVGTNDVPECCRCGRTMAVLRDNMCGTCYGQRDLPESKRGEV